jgi:hypothetical protein
MLTISLPTSIAASKRRALTTLAPTIVLALLIGCLPLRRGRTRGVLWLIAAVTITCFSLSACGGGATAGKPGPFSSSYAVTVQAVSGSLSHTVMLNLTVSQP